MVHITTFAGHRWLDLDQEVTGDHDFESPTVGDLKKFIKDLPDDYEVNILLPVDERDPFSLIVKEFP